MLLQEFPNLNWLKEKISQRFDDGLGWKGQKLEAKGWPTVLLNVKARDTVRDQIKGPLSIFSNLHGSSFVGTSQSRAKVTEDTFYITNVDQLYTLEIAEPTETFNMHVGETLSEEVLYSRSQPATYLLDNPEIINPTSPGFYNRLYWKDSFSKNCIQRLSASTSKMEEEELIAAFVDHLIQQTQHLKQQEQSLEALKVSTRQEIFRRVSLATDYIYSHYEEQISLAQLSRVSCLSKFHFLRVFKTIFHETPHQFITHLRIEKAKEYLKIKSRTVKEIAQQVGFADASTFSRSFKNKVGRYPVQFTASFAGV